MSRNLIEKKRFTVRQNSDFLHISVSSEFSRERWTRIVHPIACIIAYSFVIILLTLSSAVTLLLVPIFGFFLFLSVKKFLWCLLGKEIIRIDYTAVNSINIETKIFNLKLETQNFNQAEIFNFQVCCPISKDEPIKKGISEGEEIYALSFFHSREGRVIFARYLNERDVTEAVQLIQRYLPNLRYHWETDENKLAWLVQTLTEFALLSRFGKHSFDRLLLLSNIPNELLRDVFRDNPWLLFHLNALASGTKSVSLDGVPLAYTNYLESLWRTVAANEDTVWDVVKNIPKSLLNFILK